MAFSPEHKGTERVECMSFDQTVAMSFIKSFPEIDRKKMEAVRWTTRALLKSFIFATNGAEKSESCNNLRHL